ncbi:uncharacterized protein LACBIDRAFT_310142 [Laccaria bicolor S238N-H82]|uniref:Predicted protein n=1 Tax=Laccaria bicolor (strain S238N-H82 / ATCC MYA-4686) TaxID=486041 RepID=B0DTX4_LACBS|nr:uncharacterized protein LACBIDRAFT_310142 [Laccaria bicolor S238N-H82]EDR01988.1 predicted protein [Laccaria bicolor S238N-H82]|eukprot:XP_001887379.1 predicted protein [Laccaria bicolor S238N-H82]
MLPRTVDGMMHVCYFRHALALDERRVKFLPEYAYRGSATKPAAEPMKPINNTGDSTGTLSQTKEVWFAGTHLDIGGGSVYNQEMDRSTPPLRWMVFEAGAAGLRTKPFKRELKENEQINIIESLTGPHLGSGRKIHPGQKIHSSLVRAVGSRADNYTPKARPPLDGNGSFWKMLRDKEKQPMDEWLELDLYEHSKFAVEKLVTEGDATTLKSLHHTSISGDACQAVYGSVIKALQKEGLTLQNKHLLLCTTMELLWRSPRDYMLSPSSEVRPRLSDLARNSEYRQTAWDFVTLFTNFVKVVEIREDSSNFLAISPDGTHVASGSKNGRMIQVWEAEKMFQILDVGDDHTVPGMRQREEYRHGLRTMRERLEQAVRVQAQLHQAQVTDVAFSPDGTRIVSGSSDGTVRISDAETGSLVGEPWRGHDCQVWSVAFSPDGTRIVSGSGDETVRIWDAKTGSPVGKPLEGHDGEVKSVAFSPDGILLVSGSVDKTVRIWHVETGRPVGKPLEGHDGEVKSVAFSPDGTRVVSGSDDWTIRIWDAKTGTTVGVPLRGHRDCVLSVAFSPDGKRIGSGSRDRTVRIWDAEIGIPSGEPLQGHNQPVKLVAFSLDSTRIMSMCHRTVRTWDLGPLALLNPTIYVGQGFLAVISPVVQFSNDV